MREAPHRLHGHVYRPKESQCESSNIKQGIPRIARLPLEEEENDFFGSRIS